MLKTVSWAIVALASALSAPEVLAQEGGQYRIGVVNLKVVFDNYDRQKTAYDNLKKDRDEAQKPIDELSAQITADKDRYEKERATMSEEERRTLEDKIESAYGKYKAEFQRLQEEIDRKEKNILETLFKDIQAAVQEVGAKENYHLIFEAGENTRSGLLYFSTTLNMTQKVIDHLNSK